MFDKQLCKWINKREITIGDVLYKFLSGVIRVFFALLILIMCFQMVGIMSIIIGNHLKIDRFMDYSFPIDNLYTFLEVSLIGAIVGIISLAVIGIIIYIIYKITEIKIANCPYEKK